MTSGVIAVGDSITNGCSLDLALGGLPSRSWAQVVAEDMAAPLTVHARSGAASTEIRSDLLPHVEGAFALGLVHVGINNILSWQAWRGRQLADDLTAIVRRVTEVSERTLVLGYPTVLGHEIAYGPGLKRRAKQANAVARGVAGDFGAVFIQCPDLRGRDEVWVDGIHPTSVGHMRIAIAVLGALGREKVQPSTAEPLGAEFLRWRRREQLSFFVRQPVHNLGTWLLARH